MLHLELWDLLFALLGFELALDLLLLSTSYSSPLKEKNLQLSHSCILEMCVLVFMFTGGSQLKECVSSLGGGWIF